MATAEDLKRLVGRRTTLELLPRAAGGSTVTGRILGVLEAADGLVVTVEPDGAAPGTRRTFHYHDILTATPASDTGG